MISCLIVNYNCLNYTKKLVSDLTSQTYKDYELFVVDQASIEDGTKQFLDSMEYSGVKVMRNTENVPLNRLWNEFVSYSNGEYCSFLNNDITIPSNFLQDNYDIFKDNDDVSCVIHPTNHPNWACYTPNELSYTILDEKTRQGWDFSIRKSDWVDIPPVLDFYCGDDYIFENIYLKNKKVAMATSSPIIHWLSQTRKSTYNKVIPNRNPNKDIESYKKLGYSHYLNILDSYSKIEPQIHAIFECNK